MKKLIFYFDFLSPYSYLGWEIFKKHKEELEAQKVHIEYKPVVLSKLIKSYGTLGPAEIKPKREFLMRDCLRFSARNDILFNPPKLPFNSLLALKLSLKSSFEHQFKAIDFLFLKAWKEGEDISLDQIVEKFFDKDCVEKALSKQARIELKENLKDALSRGVFGLPSFYCMSGDSEELFWGKDSFEDVLDFFRGKSKLNESAYKDFLKQYQVPE